MLMYSDIYMKDHLNKFLPHRDADQHILIIFDGHKSHISLDLVDWPKQQKPNSLCLNCPHIPYSSATGCRMLCPELMTETFATITRYNICELFVL